MRTLHPVDLLLMCASNGQQVDRVESEHDIHDQLSVTTRHVPLE